MVERFRETERQRDRERHTERERQREGGTVGQSRYCVKVAFFQRFGARLG